MEEDLPPPPRREAAPKEAKMTKEAKTEKTDGRQKPAAEPMSVDKEPPAKVKPVPVGLLKSVFACSRPSVRFYRHGRELQRHLLSTALIEVWARHMHNACSGHHVSAVQSSKLPHVLCRLRQMATQTRTKQRGSMWDTSHAM